METKDPEFELPDPETGGCSFALIGSTRSGKTTFLMDILKRYFPKHITTLMSPSIHAPIYKEIKEPIACPIYCPRLIKEAYTINSKCNNHYDFCFILDDVVDKKFDKELLKLLTIYRNSGISCVICAQSLRLLNTASRGNVNVVLLGKLNSDEAIEQVVRAYLMSYLSGKVPEKVKEYKRLTANHNWIVVNNYSGEVFRTRLSL